ncbi:MAG: carbohydrate kinase family protein, partial [Microgenomates group bacterium]
QKGSYAYYQGKVYHQKAYPIKKIVDTTGAGDGYTAGFIAEYFRSKDIKKAMANGAKYAAKILGKIGAN